MINLISLWFLNDLKSVLFVLRGKISKKLRLGDIFHEAEVEPEDDGINVIFREFGRGLIVLENTNQLLRHVELLLTLDENLVANLLQVEVIVKRIRIQTST
jgi:hypothetical protein